MRDVPNDVTTYNFMVAEHHNYFVGAQKLWVHNCCEAFRDFSQARNAALDWLSQRGFKAEIPTMGKFGGNAGFPVGMRTADGKTGFRVEFDERSGAHINVFNGKEKGPHFTFDGNQDLVDQLIKQFRKE